MNYSILIAPAIIYIIAAIFESAMLVIEHSFKESVFMCIKNRALRRWFNSAKLPAAKYINGRSYNGRIKKRIGGFNITVPVMFLNGYYFFHSLHKFFALLAPTSICFFVYRGGLQGESNEVLILNIIMGLTLYGLIRWATYWIFRSKVFIRKQYRQLKLF